MADLARIKRNVAKMVGMGAPEADIDAYIAQEGTSVAEVQAYKAGPVQLQGKVQPQASRPTEGSSNVVDARAQPRPDLMTATANTISGITNSIPILGPLSQGIVDNVGGHISQAMGGEFDAPVERREELIQRDPVAYGAGNVAGALGSFGLMGATKLGADALGLGGKMLPGMLKAGLSNQGLYTADQYARGNSGVDTLGNGLPALAGAGGRVIGDAIQGAGQGIANAVTRGSQRRITAAATKGAPSASELKTAASQMFEASTGGKPLMISDTAYGRFYGGVKQVADKFRINVDNDQQSVGLLNTLTRILDDQANGVRVDMKDLHLVRQLAGDVAESSKGRDKAFGTAVIRQMDDFIRSLKPGDILGAADPAQAGNLLLTGIGTWARASKVGAIESAIRKGAAAASGPEKGIRNALRALMKDDQFWNTLTKAEQRAIEDVVEGTGASNALKLLGTFGFGGNTATNGIGGAMGMFLGNTLAPGVGMVAGPIIGAVSKKASERMTAGLADRAVAAAATPGLQVAKQAPNVLLPAARPADYIIRGLPGYGH